MKTQLELVENLKKTYTPPVLMNFGEVRTLTQAGSGIIGESGNSGARKKP